MDRTKAQSGRRGGLTRAARGSRSPPFRRWFGAFLVLLPMLFTLLGPLVIQTDPNALFVGPPLAGPSLQFPCGTDVLGRDQCARLVYGGQTALRVATLSLLITVCIGCLIGSMSGYLRGTADLLISLVLNMVFAIPELSLTIALIAVFGPGESSLLLALTATAWASYARLFRASVLAVRVQPYVEAARSYGASDLRILARHILPNVTRPILALASLQFGSVMLALSSLSFLGLGVQPPTADWGPWSMMRAPICARHPIWRSCRPCALW